MFLTKTTMEANRKGICLSLSMHKLILPTPQNNACLTKKCFICSIFHKKKKKKSRMKKAVGNKPLIMASEFGLRIFDIAIMKQNQNCKTKKMAFITPLYVCNASVLGVLWGLRVT